MRTHAIMVLGTSSHVGKSLLTAALCRIFAQHGYRVAPFKSQNMSLNSAVTPDGLEIGRAQALQAEAAGILPSVHMNPILLKPGGDMTSQIIVRGKIWGKLSASEYYLRRVNELLPTVCESYEILAAQNDVIVLEGAGSPAEINLKEHDIVNMRMAGIADAACLLLGDIDRGGVFGSLLGTFELLDPHERDRIAGFLINKFRGDVQLLEPGIRMIEERLGKPCLGVVPYLPGLSLDEEDSLGMPSFDSEHSAAWSISSNPSRPLRIAVIALPSFSNFTDFDALRAEPSVFIRFCRNPEELVHADVIIIPGSKQTAHDLAWMHSLGLGKRIVDHACKGLVVGICGGMQMLGNEIHDPHEMEHAASIPGLGLLAIQTTMQPQKITRISSGYLVARSLFGQPISNLQIAGYEIHVGDTTYLKGAKPFANLSTESGDGTFLDGCIAHDNRTFGTYLHGLFDDDIFRHAFLNAARAFYRLEALHQRNYWKKQREASLDRLTEAVRTAIDIPHLFRLVNLPCNSQSHTERQP
ncbi:cobyric acid synthase [Granulicella sp. 5B5]|uniref:cobyric acid synthase n=1 Tax=Granulicella sp. 5B5 TaxID=1617967 RepID=UPI0015F425EE|nr:cobyric acid synthase [Granulicella sp. 5B5]QMV17315.1 cobyric acid synthase [Granulicella sp. 5B5]